MDAGKMEQNVMDTEKIEQSVMDTFKEAGYDVTDERSVDVIGVAKGLGFVVGNAILDGDDDDGFIIVDERRREIFGIETDKLIGVNSNRSLEWKRFIIAHEIGHYVLDFQEKNLEGLYAHRDHRQGHNKRENEVDFFAANLLMPRNIFTSKYNEIKDMYDNNKEIVDALSKHFVVHAKMTERRIKELELA